MTRKGDWQSQLDRFLAARADDSFHYGAWDCCLLVCDAVRAMTGVDMAAWFRGRYANRAEAKTLIREYTRGLSSSVASVARTVAAAHGLPIVEPALAQRGDVVLIRRNSREFSLGIVSLKGGSVLVLTPKGIRPIPLSLAVTAWRI
jgi:hypothetical protein